MTDIEVLQIQIKALKEEHRVGALSALIYVLYTLKITTTEPHMLFFMLHMEQRLELINKGLQLTNLKLKKQLNEQNKQNKRKKITNGSPNY